MRDPDFRVPKFWPELWWTQLSDFAILTDCLGESPKGGLQKSCSHPFDPFYLVFELLVAKH